MEYVESDPAALGSALFYVDNETRAPFDLTPFLRKATWPLCFRARAPDARLLPSTLCAAAAALARGAERALAAASHTAAAAATDAPLLAPTSGASAPADKKEEVALEEALAGDAGEPSGVLRLEYGGTKYELRARDGRWTGALRLPPSRLPVVGGGASGGGGGSGTEEAEERAEDARRLRPLMVDTFLFYNEPDMLEARLRELDEAVDYFVLVEGARTFSGARKRLWYAEEAALDGGGRFARWASRIVHVVVADEPPTLGRPGNVDADPWLREYHQRAGLLRGARRLGLVAADMVMLSDVDELPDACMLAGWRASGAPPLGKPAAALSMAFFYYDFAHMLPYEWRGTVIARWDYAERHSAQDLRHQRTRLPHVRCGVHASYFGDASKIVEKIQNFAHQELNTPGFANATAVEARIALGADLFERGDAFAPPPHDLPLPRHWRLIDRRSRLPTSPTSTGAPLARALAGTAAPAAATTPAEGKAAAAAADGNAAADGKSDGKEEKKEPGGRAVVLSATYGAGTAVRDVTAAVVALGLPLRLAHDSPPELAPTRLFGSDPAPCVAKRLRVYYRVAGAATQRAELAELGDRWAGQLLISSDGSRTIGSAPRRLVQDPSEGSNTILHPWDRQSMSSAIATTTVALAEQAAGDRAPHDVPAPFTVPNAQESKATVTAAHKGAAGIDGGGDGGKAGGHALEEGYPTGLAPGECARGLRNDGGRWWRADAPLLVLVHQYDGDVRWADRLRHAHVVFEKARPGQTPSLPHGGPLGAPPPHGGPLGAPHPHGGSLPHGGPLGAPTPHGGAIGVSPRPGPFVAANVAKAESNLLKFCAEFYDDLPPFIAQVYQYERKACHEGSLVDLLNDPGFERRLANSRTPGFLSINCMAMGDARPQHAYMMSSGWWSACVAPYFPGAPMPALLGNWTQGKMACAQFVVSRDRVRSLPRAFYANMYAWLVRHGTGGVPQPADAGGWRPAAAGERGDPRSHFWTSRYLEWTWELFFTAAKPGERFHVDVSLLPRTRAPTPTLSSSPSTLQRTPAAIEGTGAVARVGALYGSQLFSREATQALLSRYWNAQECCLHVPADADFNAIFGDGHCGTAKVLRVFVGAQEWELPERRAVGFTLELDVATGLPRRTRFS